MYYVHALKSQADGKLYFGYTINLRAKFRAHQGGEVISTKHRRPFDSIFYEAYENMEDAKHRERYFKTSRRKSSLRMKLQNSPN